MVKMKLPLTATGGRFDSSKIRDAACCVSTKGFSRAELAAKIVELKIGIARLFKPNFPYLAVDLFAVYALYWD
jgi:hypothetical protein